MKSILLDLQYLPPVAYFAAIKQADEVWIEANENFVKQTYRNRCKILSTHGVQDLSIPVHHAGKKILIRDLTIDHKQKWMNTHWRAIQSAYGKSPFFDYYADEIEQVILSKSENLFDLNWQLLSICLKYLNLSQKPVFLTKSYTKTPENGVVDLRSVIHPKKPAPEWFREVPYHQIFGEEFVPNLTILDLLFCEGPGADVLLGQSCVKDSTKYVFTD